MWITGKLQVRGKECIDGGHKVEGSVGLTRQESNVIRHGGQLLLFLDSDIHRLLRGLLHRRHLRDECVASSRSGEALPAGGE